MKTTYLIWQDPNCGGNNPEWVQLTKEEFIALTRSPEGKERHFIKLHSVSGDGSDGAIIMEATASDYRDWKQKKNHADYLRRDQSKATVISYNALGESYGEELLTDEDIDIETGYIQAHQSEFLFDALAKLSEDERRMIEFLYLSDKKGTERSYADLTGIPQKTVHNRKVRALQKLKIFFEG